MYVFCISPAYHQKVLKLSNEDRFSSLFFSGQSSGKNKRNSKSVFGLFPPNCEETAKAHLVGISGVIYRRQHALHLLRYEI